MTPRRKGRTDGRAVGRRDGEPHARRLPDDRRGRPAGAVLGRRRRGDRHDKLVEAPPQAAGGGELAPHHPPPPPAATTTTDAAGATQKWHRSPSGRWLLAGRQRSRRVDL